MKGAVRRVGALMLQEFYITRHSVEMFFDILFFPLVNVILFGLISVFITGVREAASAPYLLLGILLWEIITVAQYNVTISSLWSVWSHNLTNIFIAPISVREYMTAHILAAALRSVSVVAILSLGGWLFFDFNLLDVGLINLALFTINLIIFASWLGVILLGFIFRYGTRIQAISWGTVFLFQPLTAAFFPVAVLPGWLQGVAYTLPPTYVFEAARQALDGDGINMRYAFIAFGLNLAYAGLAALVFRQLFRRSRETGQFARNDL